MKRTELPTARLHELPKSTRYDWETKIGFVCEICVWAACVKANRTGAAIPSIDTVWGMTDVAISAYQNSRTGEMRISLSDPTEHYWVPAVKSAKTSSWNVESASESIFLSVQDLFYEPLSRAEKRVLLDLFPIFGVYQGEFWTAQASKSLRDLNVTRSAEEEFHRKMDFVVKQPPVIKVFNLFRDNARMVIPKHKLQKELLYA